MSVIDQSKRVGKTIEELYNLRKLKLIILAKSYAGRALRLFRKEQAEQTFWTNQTNQAFQRVFSRAIVDQSEIGFLLAHGVDYGVYLELANDRKNEAIRPIMMHLAPLYLADAKKIIGATN